MAHKPIASVHDLLKQAVAQGPFADSLKAEIFDLGKVSKEFDGYLLRIECEPDRKSAMAMLNRLDTDKLKQSTSLTPPSLMALGRNIGQPLLKARPKGEKPISILVRQAGDTLASYENDFYKKLLPKARHPEFEAKLEVMKLLTDAAAPGHNPFIPIYQELRDLTRAGYRPDIGHMANILFDPSGEVHANKLGLIDQLDMRHRGNVKFEAADNFAHKELRFALLEQAPLDLDPIADKALIDEHQRVYAKLESMMEEAKNAALDPMDKTALTFAKVKSNKVTFASSPQDLLDVLKPLKQQALGH